MTHVRLSRALVIPHAEHVVPSPRILWIRWKHRICPERRSSNTFFNPTLIIPLKHTQAAKSTRRIMHQRSSRGFQTLETRSCCAGPQPAE